MGRFPPQRSNRGFFPSRLSWESNPRPLTLFLCTPRHHLIFTYDACDKLLNVTVLIQIKPELNHSVVQREEDEGLT